MEKTTENKKKAAATLRKRKTAVVDTKGKRVHPRWLEFQKLIGTGEILDMRAVLK